MRSSRQLVFFLFLVFSVSCFGGLLQGFRRNSEPSIHYSFFETPSSIDPWSQRIKDWQARQHSKEGAGKLLQVSSDKISKKSASLYEEYKLIRENHKLILAYGISKWIQTQANLHYIPDDPAHDNWATLSEVLAKNGDDCDGLELLVFWFLRDVGFGEDEVFHGIFESQDPRDDYHMVTLWFEDPNDPWIIDPTGAITLGLKRLSQISDDWKPIRVFNNKREFTVRAREMQ